MPIKPENVSLYPKDWPNISRQAKERAKWRCVQPGCHARQYSVGRWMRGADDFVWHPHVECPGSYAEAKELAAEYSFSLFGDGHVPLGESPVIVIVLTTAHLDHDPTNCEPENLAPMCQRHHLRYDAEHHRAMAYATRMKARGNLELAFELKGATHG